MVAAKCARLKVGQPRKETESIPPIGGISQPTATATRDEAAKILSVGTSSIDRAKRVIENAPELVEKIERGEMTVNAAYEATRDKSTQKPQSDHQSAFVPMSEEIGEGKESKAMACAKQVMAIISSIPLDDIFFKDAMHAIEEQISIRKKQAKVSKQ
jgi:hypothetical protein